MSKGLSTQQQAILDILSKPDDMSSCEYTTVDILRKLRPSTVRIDYTGTDILYEKSPLWSVNRALLSLRHRGLVIHDRSMGYPVWWSLSDKCRNMFPTLTKPIKP